MTRNPVRTLLAVALVGLTSACDTTSVGPYRSSVTNVIGLRTSLATQEPIALGEFTRLAEVSGRPGCRGLGPIDVAPGSSVERYVRDAFQTELFEAEKLSVEAGAKTVRGQLEELQLDTFGTGLWTLAVRLVSDEDPAGVLIRVEYPFSTSWMAESACSNAAMAFGPAVSALIAETVRVRAIDRLVGASPS